jgi:hypothetical protein
MQKQKITFIPSAVWVLIPAGSDCTVLGFTRMYITENRSKNHTQRPWLMHTYT